MPEAAIQGPRAESVAPFTPATRTRMPMAEQGDGERQPWKELTHENNTQSDLGRHDGGVATSRWARTNGEGKTETRRA